MSLCVRARVVMISFCSDNWSIKTSIKSINPTHIMSLILRHLCSTSLIHWNAHQIVHISFDKYFNRQSKRINGWTYWHTINKHRRIVIFMFAWTFCQIAKFDQNFALYIFGMVHWARRSLALTANAKVLANDRLKRAAGREKNVAHHVSNGKMMESQTQP